MESSDSVDNSWDTSSDATKTAQRSDPAASSDPPASIPHGWMVNVAGRDVVEMAHADVLSKWRSGEISGKSLVWREGMESWAVLESVPAFQIVSRPSQPVASARPLASPPPAPARQKPPPAKAEPVATEELNPVAVYERPVATLVFDEGVKDDWKPVAKAREPSKVTRGSGSSRPPAPALPPFAPRAARPTSAVVPPDKPPPPPPLPSRARLGSERPRPTIPGGLAPPAPATLTIASDRPSASVAPAGPQSSPLLAAIAAAASGPEPLVIAAPSATPMPGPLSALPSLDEVSVSARLRAMKSVSMRSAVLACAGSALVASLLTGLVVASSTRRAARATVVAPKAALAAPGPVAAAPAATQEPTAAPASPPSESTGVEAVALGDLKTEKPKAATPSRARAWKPPSTSATRSDETAAADTPPASHGRDDPERAVPEPGSAKPANWHADPGF